MDAPSDYSDQAIASYVYWMWRRTHDWGRVWFKVQEKFQGEPAIRLENVFARARAAIAELPMRWKWKVERTQEQLHEAATRRQSNGLRKRRR